MSFERYCSFIAPAHPLVREFFAGGPGWAPGAEALERILAFTRGRCRYVSGPPGRSSFETLQAAWRRSLGEGFELNCINLVCLLASGLRASGCPPDGVYAAVGRLRGAAGGTTLPLEPIHAWLLVPVERGFLWVDPADLAPEPRSGPDLVARYALFAIFNDARACVLRDDRRRLLLGEAA